MGGSVRFIFEDLSRSGGFKGAKKRKCFWSFSQMDRGHVDSHFHFCDLLLFCYSAMA